MALTVNLIGPSPWGFRIYGGRDFKKAITVSKVIQHGRLVAEPRHTLSNHILLFLHNMPLQAVFPQSQLPPHYVSFLVFVCVRALLRNYVLDY